MLSITDPVTQWSLAILLSVVLGTLVLIGIAFLRRWQQIRHGRYVHKLQRQYRSKIAMVLSGAPARVEIECLRTLSMSDLELLFDPLFSKRQLPERCRVFLQALCVELGLTDLWQSRLSESPGTAPTALDKRLRRGFPDRSALRHVQRAKSIRNLGSLRHQPSWPLLINALSDPHRDIQLVTLRALAALSATETFPLLAQSVHAAVEAETASQTKQHPTMDAAAVQRPTVQGPLVQGLVGALSKFNVCCAPSLLPLLRHPDRKIRTHATRILQTMVCNTPALHLTQELLTSPLVELLLSELPFDASAEIRARVPEVLVRVIDPRVQPVLRRLLADQQWFVRLRTLRALACLRDTTPSLCQDVVHCLCDPNWRVREGAGQTLMSFGQEGRRQLFKYFLVCPDQSTRQQIVEMIERTGLMSTLVEEYSGGANGLEAQMVERLAGDAAPLGLPGVLDALDPDIRQRFLDRFIPHDQFKSPLRKRSVQILDHHNTTDQVSPTQVA